MKYTIKPMILESVEKENGDASDTYNLGTSHSELLIPPLSRSPTSFTPYCGMGVKDRRVGGAYSKS